MGQLFFYFCLQQCMYYSRFVAQYPGQLLLLWDIWWQLVLHSSWEVVTLLCMSDGRSKCEVWCVKASCSLIRQQFGSMSFTALKGSKSSQPCLTVMQSSTLTIVARLFVGQKSKQFCCAQHWTYNTQVTTDFKRLPAVLANLLVWRLRLYGVCWWLPILNNIILFADILHICLILVFTFTEMKHLHRRIGNTRQY